MPNNPPDKVLVFDRSQYTTGEDFATALSAAFDEAHDAHKRFIFLFSNGMEFFFQRGY